MTLILTGYSFSKKTKISIIYLVQLNLTKAITSIPKNVFHLDLIRNEMILITQSSIKMFYNTIQYNVLIAY